MSFKGKRLQKELAKLHTSISEGLSLVSTETLDKWLLDIRVLDDNPLYRDQIYRLQFKFSDRYPIEPPEVQFLAISNPPRPIPMHPHIYSNGIVCLDLLGAEGWSPVQHVESVAMSLQSMLTGNSKNERPPGDEEFCRQTRPGQSTRGIGFVYHDDNV